MSRCGKSLVTRYATPVSAATAVIGSRNALYDEVDTRRTFCAFTNGKRAPLEIALQTRNDIDVVFERVRPTANRSATCREKRGALSYLPVVCVCVCKHFPRNHFIKRVSGESYENDTRSTKRARGSRVLTRKLVETRNTNLQRYGVFTRL